MATIKDVAKLAGVSVSAVSKYLRTPQHMREETRSLIASAIKELDYSPNLLARNLRSGRTGFIAIECSNITNPYSATLAKYMQAYCSEQNLVAMFIQSDSVNNVNHAMSILKTGFFDGIICYECNPLMDAIHEAELQIPMVQIAPLMEPDGTPSIYIDLEQGTRLLLDHLKSRGVESIAYFGPADDTSSTQKYDALLAYAREHDMTVNSDYTAITNASNYEQISAVYATILAEKRPLPDAIVCTSDYVAVYVLKVLADAGIRIPEDVMLTGFDDTELAVISNPSLTSVHTPLKQISEAAVQQLTTLIEGGTPQTMVFVPELSIRHSTDEKSDI